ncbi:MAG: hypothetical protein JRD03_11040 [Deltaproteobacteria bacterium]|nr:hypothetical protein [Deltaproteobacteria bacterium]
MSITEETLGSSTSHVDTDGDGISDLQEATAGARGGTDPNQSNRDADGLIDWSNLEPAEESEHESR